MSRAHVLYAHNSMTPKPPRPLYPRSRLEGLPDCVSVHKLAFHLQRSPGETKENEKPMVIPTVGWVHQMCSAHKVHLKRAPQVAAVDTRGGTTVVRLVATAMWTPKDIWASLQKGRLQPMKDEAETLLRDSAARHISDLYDVFNLQMQGKSILCNMRISNQALRPLLAQSGKHWLFIHPLGAANADYPTVWAGTAWPPDLSPTYQRAKDVGCLGLTLGERHVGFRTQADSEAQIRLALDAPSRQAWLLAGVPVSYNIDDAGRLLDELGASGKILDQTRRVVRGTQNWVVHLLDNTDPQEDTLHVAVDSRDFFVTLTPLRAKRQAQPPVKQWRRAAKPSPRSEDHDLPAQRNSGKERSWAQVVRNQESQKSPPAQSSESHARLALLERTVATLIGLLKEVGQELPSSGPGRSEYS